MLVIKSDEIPEEGLTLKWVEERHSLLAYMEGFSQVDFDFEKPLHAEATILKSGMSILVKGKVETNLLLHCVRCLKEFSYPLSSTFELTLFPLKESSMIKEKELEEGDLESDFFEEGEIHLSEIACEQIFLELPYQPLCQEGCKGLCPRCGSDLNLSPCSCEGERMGIGFLGLEKLKLK